MYTVKVWNRSVVHFRSLISYTDFLVSCIYYLIIFHWKDSETYMRTRAHYIYRQKVLIWQLNMSIIYWPVTMHGYCASLLYIIKKTNGAQQSAPFPSSNKYHVNQCLAQRWRPRKEKVRKEVGACASWVRRWEDKGERKCVRGAHMKNMSSIVNCENGYLSSSIIQSG